MSRGLSRRCTYPGKLIDSSWRRCNFGWGGGEWTSSSYDVLIEEKGTWSMGPTSGALVGGHEANGTPLHICRATVNIGGIYHGTASGKLVGNTCSIGYGGHEEYFSSYSLFYESTIPPMSIPPAEMPYDATKAAEEQALRDNPPPWDSSDAYAGDNSQSPVETVRQLLTMMDPTGTITLFHHEEEDTWGGNRWAAGYQLKAYAKTKRDSWTANSSTHGYVNAWGKILASSFPAFTATVVANTINNPNSKWAGIWYSIYVFGNKVKEETVGGGVYNVEKKIFAAEQPVTPEI